MGYQGVRRGGVNRETAIDSHTPLCVKHRTDTNVYSSEEKAMATHSSVLAWGIPGTGEPGGLPAVGSHRVGHD